MKILMLSTDERIFSPQSAVRERMRDYGGIVEKLYIIIPTTNRGYVDEIKISSKVFAYPAYGRSKLGARLAVLRIARKIRADLVTAQDPFETGLVAWLVASFTSAKLELQIHTDFLSPYFSKESALNRVRVRLAKFLLSKADSVRVVSKRILDSIKTENYILKTNPIVLPVFVDIEKIRNTTPRINLHKKYPQFSFIVLMASRLTREKNIGLAVEVMNKIVRKYPRVGLVIVGSGREEGKLREEISSYRLQDNVILEPWQNNLFSYYRSADLFLNTSNYEGFGITLIEAMLLGCPIVSTSVGIVGEILRKDVGILTCRVGDANCLEKNIARFISSPDFYKEISTKAGVAIVSIFKNKSEYLEKVRESWKKALLTQKSKSVGVPI